MDTRITPQTQAARATFFMSSQSDQLANLQLQASSGLRLNTPSDGPLDFVSVMANKAQDQRFDAYLTNISTATSNLNSSVSTLTEASDLLTQAQTIAQQGAQGGNDPATNETLAQQVENVISNLINLGNTQSNGQYIFGGTATSKPPFSVATTNAQGQPQTIAYNGAQLNSQIDVSKGQTVDSNVAGSQVFQVPGADVFQSLIGLRDALRNVNNLDGPGQVAAISQQLGAIQSAHTAVLSAVGAQSNALQNLSGLQAHIQGVQTQTKTLISNTESADITDVVVKLQEAQNSFQLTLASSAKLFSQSLLDFLHT